MNKRELAAWGLTCSGAGRLKQVSQKLAGVRDRLYILAYHRVTEPGGAPWDPDQVSCYPKQFEQQIAFLARNFQITSFARIKAAGVAGEPLPPLSLILTFDDGYRDNYEVAYPILKKYGISATIFLAADYIDRQDIFWWDKLYYVIAHSPRKVLKLTRLPEATDIDLSNRAAALQRLLGWAKQWPDAQRRALLAEVEEQAGVGVNPQDFPRQAVNWDEVREMGRDGLEFGGHTLSHPILSRLPEGELEKEIAGGRKRIQQETGQPVDCFCYPVGLADTFDDRTVKAIEQAGFSYATTALPGINDLQRDNPLYLKRFWVSPADSLAVFKQRLLFPEIFKY